MSGAPVIIRPAVRSCVMMAARAAISGDHPRAQSLFALALDLATPAEVATVLGAAERVLPGVAAPPMPPAPAPGEEAPAVSADPAEEPAALESAVPVAAEASAPEAEAPPVSGAAVPAAQRLNIPPPPRPAPVRARKPARRKSGAGMRYGRPLLGAVALGAIFFVALSRLTAREVDLREIEASIEQGKAEQALQQLDAIGKGGADVDLLRGRALLSRGDTAGAVRILREMVETEAVSTPAAQGARRILQALTPPAAPPR